MLPTHGNIKQDNNNKSSYGRKGIGDEVLELPIGILQDDTGQVVGNERTHNNNIMQATTTQQPG